MRVGTGSLLPSVLLPLAGCGDGDRDGGEDRCRPVSSRPGDTDSDTNSNSNNDFGNNTHSNTNSNVNRNSGRERD